MPLPVISQPKVYDLVIYRGQTRRLIFQFWQDKSLGVVANLTGVTTFTAMVRAAFVDAAPIVTLTCTCPTPTNGQVIIALTKAQTLAIAIPVGMAPQQRSADLGPWDFEMSDGTDSYRYVEGTAKYSLESSF